MHPIVVSAVVWKDFETRREELRRYARTEYGDADAAWLFAEARREPRPRIAERIRYWLGSFRGYAAFDVRGVDDPARA